MMSPRHAQKRGGHHHRRALPSLLLLLSLFLLAIALPTAVPVTATSSTATKRAAEATTTVEELVCPVDWTRLAYPAASSTMYVCARVLASAAALAVPRDTTPMCDAALTIYPPRLPKGDASHIVLDGKNYTYDFAKATVQPVSVHSAADNAAVHQLFASSLAATAAAAAQMEAFTQVSLGGVAGFGTVDWFDGSTGNTDGSREDEGSAGGDGQSYHNFDPAVEWLQHSDCIGMRLSDGKWVLVPCQAGELPYMCTFPLTTDLVKAVVVVDKEDSSGGSGDDSSAVSSVSGGQEEPSGPRFARRPPVPEPVPACLPGWTALPATGTTTTQAGAMCYKAFAPAGEVGTYGKTFNAANAFCAAKHPRGALANVFSSAEDDWVLREVVLGDPRLAALAKLAANSSTSSASVTESRRMVAFLGAIYMSTSPTTLIGSWYGDAFLYNESEYARSAPSSPAWPTAQNGYYQHWAASQPRNSYGCLAMALYNMSFTSSTAAGVPSVSNIAAGEWVSEDCRSTQPFVCAYVNDGSTFPVQPSESSSSSPESQPTSTPDPDSVCLEGWSLYEPTGTCYRVALASSAKPSGGDDDDDDELAVTGPVSPAILEERCKYDLIPRAANPDVGHSAVITSAEESAFVGGVLASLAASVAASGGSTTTTTARPPSTALVGVSFGEYGEYGMYLDGQTSWRPYLAESLWATGQPVKEKGCVAVDAQGWWSYTSCGLVGEAYACQYRLDELVRRNDTTSTTEGPTPTRTPRPPPPGDTVPLAERIASLSGAVHLVVSAGTVGTYTVESRGGLVDGLLFYFAPISPYYTHPESVSALPVGLYPLGQLMFDDTTYAPCAGYKKQEELSAVAAAKLVVSHGRKLNTSAGESLFVNEVGYVCVSEDGKNYVPTRITYEVVGAALKGLVPVAARNKVTHLKDHGITKKLTTYLPPLFHDAQSALAAAQVDLGIQRYTSGTLQVALQADTTRTSFHVHASGEEEEKVVEEENSYLSHLRLSATPDCMDPAYTFLARDIPITDVTPYRERANSTTSAIPVYGITYQWADIAVTHLGQLDRLVDPPLFEDIPVVFHVCVAARKRPSATRTIFTLWNYTAVSAADELRFANASDRLDLAVANGVAMKRMMALGSLAAPTPNAAAAQEEERIVYTAVPGVTVHVVEPPVSVTGLWAVPPQPLAHIAFAANATSAVRRTSFHPQLLVRQQQAPSSSADAVGSTYVPSSTTIRVPQYSSPVLVLDAEGAGEGMSLLLSRFPSDGEEEKDADSCDRTQYVAHSDPTNPDVPPSLDTMLPISVLTVPVTVFTDNGTGSGNVKSETRRKKVAFTQLNLNVTGMWGTNVSTQATQKWRVCFSYSTTGEFLPLTPLTIVVERVNIAAVTAVTAAGAAESEETDHAVYIPSSAGNPLLNVNVGFTGLWRLWGLDVRMWSATTLHNAQVVFAKPLPDDGGDEADATFQCANPSLFYNQKGLGIVAPPSASTGAAGTAHSLVVGGASNSSTSAYAALVIPPGFLRDVSARRLRLCLSVPQPFRATRRAFYPTTVTVDVRPVQILYIGRYSAASSPSLESNTSSSSSSSTSLGTVLQVAEEADNVVFPLVGYGLRPDMMLFLSDKACYGRDLVGGLGSLVERQSLRNISLTAPYDLPPNYWASDSLASGARGGASAAAVYMVLTQESLTGKAIADGLFGVARTPLQMCLYAPGTSDEVYSTDFSLVVLPPTTKSVENIQEKDAKLIALAMGNRTFYAKEEESEEGTAAVTRVMSITPPWRIGLQRQQQQHRSAAATTLAGDDDDVKDADAIVVYAAYMDLLVDGFGLLESETVFIPAVDCSNASSFLWRNPARLSPIPSSRGHDFFAQSARYIDPQTSTSSWYLPLRQSESTRLGAEDPVDGLVNRFTWCVRYRTRDAYLNITTTTDDAAASANSADSTATTTTTALVYNWTRGFVSTGVPYHMVIPRVDGFRFGNRISQRITLPVQDKDLGQWQKIQLVGPLIDITFDVGNPLYMFLADASLSCKDVKNYYVTHNLTEEKIILAVDGSAVIMPKLLSTAGTYKFCASAVYPEARSAQPGTEAALQFFTLPGLSLTLYDPVYAVFLLNHTTSVKVEHGQEWTLPLAASELSNYSLIRFQPLGTSCDEPMVGVSTTQDGERTTTTLPDITVQNLFPGYPLFDADTAADSEQYIVLEREFIRALPAPVTYQLCFKANRATPWTASAVTLRVVEHVRRPTQYSYFAADGSEDVVGVTALAPTKVALDWLTGEEDTDNIVGALGREVVLALQCLNGHTADVDACPCSSSSPSSPLDSDAESTTGNASVSSFRSASVSSFRSASSPGGCDCDVDAAETVPCGNHRRVLFVKPMDDDSDPCFVDWEAVQGNIYRGPYVVDDGILTLPHSLSGVSVSQYPNMTQPWIMCLETGPERWREPIYPLFQLQYTGAIPVGFRAEADDPSNTTATFPATGSAPGGGLTASNTATDRTDREGNTTLHLFAGDSSQVYYLNGYGIQRGFTIRFGARCEEDLTAAQMDAAGVTAENVSRLVASRQKLSNTLLYEEPLPIEDDHGVFLVPRTHQLREETYVLPMCLSTNGGATYAKTNLSVAVLPSRLKRGLPSQEEDLVQRVLGDTLVVPRGSTGNVNVTDLAACAAAKQSQGSSATGGSGGGVVDLGSSNTDDNNNGGWPAIDDEEITTMAPRDSAESEQAATPFFPPGTEVVLSSSCGRNAEGLPIMVVSSANVFALTTRHTAVATETRLRICAKFPATTNSSPQPSTTSTTSTAAPGGGNTHEVIGDDSGSSNPGDSGGSTNPPQQQQQPLHGFTDTGLYYHVLGVSVGSVSVHQWAGNSDVAQIGIDQLVLRRATEDLLLSVSLASGTGTGADGGNTVGPIDSVCAAGSSVSEDCIKEVFLRMLDTPGALPFFSLARFNIGKPCLGVRDDADLTPPSMVVSPTALKAAFSNSSLSVTGLFGNGPVGFVASLPYSSTQVQAQGEPSPYPPWAPASLCLSVDGGRHYLSVGIAYFTADWAPTLRAQLNPRDDDGDNAQGTTTTPVYTNNITLFEQTSVYAKLSDTRYDASIYANPDAEGTAAATTPPFDVTPANLYLNRFTMDALWSGFLGESGFASQGVLYLPSTLATLANDTDTDTDKDDEGEGGKTASQELPFYPSNRFNADDSSTGGGGERTSLRLYVEPFHLSCVGNAGYTVTEEYMRRLDNGRLVPVASTCGGASIPEGTILRLVDSHNDTVSSKEACAIPAVHSAGHLVLDMPVVKPSLWAPPGAKAAMIGAGAAAADEVADHNDDDEEDVATQIQLPPALRYVPDGTYHICVKKYLWSHREAWRRQEEAVFVPSPVQLLVTANLTVLRVARATSGIVAVYQGSNTAVPIEGTAVGLRGMPLLMALAPVLPHAVRLVGGKVVNLSRGCLDLPSLRDPTTGESLVNVTASTDIAANDDSPPEDLLLAAPWQNAQDGWWRVPAAYLRHITNQTLYYLCYSVNNGLTFDFIENRLADVSLYDGEADEGPIPRVVTVAVRPPTMVGVALNATAQGVVAQDMYTRRSTELHFDAGWTTPSALRVHRFSFLTNGTNTDVANPVWPSPAQPAVVRTFGYSSLVSASGATTTLLSRAPSYYFNPTNTLVGNGMGVNSFRAYWPAAGNDGSSSSSSSSIAADADDADYFTENYFVEREEETAFARVKDRVPSVAAAVAVLRTSRFGQICSGPLPNHNVSYGTAATTTTGTTGTSTDSRNGVLAMPIFLLNLKTTTVWSEADEERFAAELAALEEAGNASELAAAVRAMNPVLSRTDFRDNTAALRARYNNGTSAASEGGVLHVLSLLAMATSEAEAATRAVGEALLVCVSVDGENFLSANAPILPSVGSLSNASVAVPGVNSNVARRALRLRRLSATAPSNRPIALLNVSSVPMLIRPEPATVLTAAANTGANTTAYTAVGTFFTRDLTLRTSVVVRPNITALRAGLDAVLLSNSSSAAEKATAQAELAALGSMSATDWQTALGVAPSPQMLARVVEALSHEIGVEGVVFVVQVQPTGSVAAPSAAAVATTALRDRLVQRAAAAPESELGTSSPAAGSLQLPTYDLLINIAADAYFINTTSQTRTLTPAPEILLHVVDVLRSNVTQYPLLKPLLFLPSASAQSAAVSASAIVAKVRASAYVSSIAMNFTFSNGVDVSRLRNATTPSSSTVTVAHVLEIDGVNYTLPTYSAREMGWRNAFMAIPHDTVAAVPIPDDPTNDTTDKVTWWVVPLLLIFPAFLIAGTYYVYKKYLAKPKDEEVTIEASA